jgi:predicted nucleic acid-binding protein
MARQLLDTTSLINFSKGFEASTSCIKHILASGDEVGVCPVIVAEIFAGLPPQRHQDWDTFLSTLLFWPISYAASVQAGQWRYAFARRGIQVAMMDSLVAAVAHEIGATIVTSNVKDYPMGLPLFDPRTWSP